MVSERLKNVGLVKIFRDVSFGFLGLCILGLDFIITYRIVLILWHPSLIHMCVCMYKCMYKYFLNSEPI